MGLLFEKESFDIRGSVFEVYKELGNGFQEAVYQECLENELKSNGIPFVPQPDLKLTYKGTQLKQTYKPDLICYDKIILELKATRVIIPEHKAQVINYLKMTELKLGLLINFGHSSEVQIERLVL